MCDLIETNTHFPTLSVKLSGYSNYGYWKDAAEAMLDYYEILEVVTGKETRPTEAITSGAGEATTFTTDDPATRAWDKKNKWARVFILQNIEPDVHRPIAKSRMASEMWRSLEDMFERKPTSTLYQLVGDLMTLRYTPETTALEDYVALFAIKWQALLDRTSQYADDKDGFGFHMHRLVKDSESKAAFLLLSIQHGSTQNAAGILQTQAKLLQVIEHLKTQGK